MNSQSKQRLTVLTMALGALFVTSWFELFLQRKQNLVGGGISRPFLFILINVHVIAIVTLLFIIIRKSIKLIVERRKNVPGSLFKRNLLFAFTFFSVIPSFFVFFAAGKFITRSIDDWFHARISTGLQSGLRLHKEQSKHIRKIITQYGHDLLKEARAYKNNTNKSYNYAYYTSGDPLVKRAHDLFDFYTLNVGKQKTLLGALNTEGKMWRRYRKNNDRSIKSLKLKFITKINSCTPNKGKLFDFYGCLYWVHKTNNQFMILVYRYPENLRGPLIEIQNALEDYQQLKSMKNPIYATYIFSFILVTLLILFLSVWCAFYLSKGLSQPIQDLLNATRKMRHGELDVLIPDKPDSDLAMLTHGFNEMALALRQAHNELKRKNNEMLTILENIKASVFFVNKFGRILTCNRAAKELVEKYLHINNFMNQKISFLGPDVLNKMHELVRKMLTQNIDIISEELSFTSNDQTRVFMIHMSIVSTATIYSSLNQNIDRNLLVVIEDLTDIVKMSKMKTWREAAQQVAHEIKNPLTPIQLATQRLQRKYHDILEHEPAFLECTNTILNQVTIIKNLASYFSEFASLPSTETEPAQLNNIIQEIVQFYQLGYPDINIDFTADPLLPIIPADKKKIKRVIANLLDNSIKAFGPDQTDAQKTITIKSRYDLQIKKIEILFSDNGPGINKNVKNHIFLPYVSTSKKNMGLGLAIVHDIISQHGGSITLLSNNQKNKTSQGAIFQILLPVNKKK